MAKLVNIKEIVKHIVNGTLNESLCRICLLPLNALNEDMFTKICKNDKEYCIADVLEKICDIKIFPEDKYKICLDCFKAASSAYKFYLLNKRSEEILDFYINLLEQQINLIEISENVESDSLCIKIPLLNPETDIFDYNLNGVLNDNTIDYNEGKHTIEESNNNSLEHSQNISENEDDTDIVIIADENGDRTFFKEQNGSLVPINDIGKKQLNDALKIVFPEVDKVRRKRRRNPMSYMNCSQCPVRYKFVSKLKEHMKSEHDIDLFVCSICKQVIEDEDEFKKHLESHTDVHKCTECNMVFKTKERIIAHQKWHDKIEDMKGTEEAHVCEVCGLVLLDEDQLIEHNEKKHMKKYTCYYCGRMYKGENSFEFHIKKHEMHMMGDAKKRTNSTNIKEDKNVSKKKFSCATCQRDFVDDRSLMWHQRLHTNERPYVCDVCGRGFVSLNRRNQHAVCAHTAPARRCPLCPALFHLRSMVNTHVKKVHLKEHKRRNRSSKHQNVFWRTQPVPIQELSVSIQNEILELQAQQAKVKSENNIRNI
ncbi:Myoneurin [Papilio machaon]|uniref:Myoneurin n=1 Tax=Papilio machaon TaxID=76193 RepID=A0A0N1IFY6_PAPMA|nr:Myoneurin [Papilio machaon]